MKRPGLRVSARKGYVSPRALSAEDRLKQERERERGRGRAGTTETSTELRDMLTQPLQRNGLTMTVQAAPFKGASRQASVALAVEVDAARLHFTEQPNKTFADGMELSIFALDERGRQHGGTFYQFNLTLRPETFERVRGSVVRLNPRIALPAGRYQLRVGVRETGAGEMGSVFYDLNVPDYQARGIAMSGLLLTDQAARTQFTPQLDEDLPAGTLPSPATSRRVQPERRAERVRGALRQQQFPRSRPHRSRHEPDRRRRRRPVSSRETLAPAIRSYPIQADSAQRDGAWSLCSSR